MDAVETAFARNMQQHGWWTKSKELSTVRDESKHEVDIIAYNPKTRKMFYGNLTHLSHDGDEDSNMML
ncbi:MAG: hypothetical protein A2Y07_00015 [Planctomycetes bacterium GWF2_50_10]|nr:MAG: hypothetical protein A2Y07_00015 [Planctomycetes bacterium GWF2_50_10]